MRRSHLSQVPIFNNLNRLFDRLLNNLGPFHRTIMKARGRNVQQLPFDASEIGKRNWSYGLFDCFEEMDKCKL